MAWQFQTQTIQTARKEYECEASVYVEEFCVPDEFEPEDKADYEKAKAEDFKILPGTRYVKVTGVWEGEWQTFRAREDMHNLCIKHDFYPED